MTVINTHAHLVSPDLIDVLADRGRDFGIDLVEQNPISMRVGSRAVCRSVRFSTR